MKIERSVVLIIILAVTVLHPFINLQASPSFERDRENGTVLEQRQHVNIEVLDNGKLSIVSDVYEEIEHYSENANIFSQHSVGYSETFSKISDLEAFSFTPTANGKFKKIKVNDFQTTDSRSNGIFYDDQKKISFVYPALKAGSRTVLSYKKEFKEPRLWGYYLFSSFFPVQKSVLKVSAPATVNLRFKIFGIDADDVLFEKTKKGKKVIYQWTAEELDKIEISKGADGILHTAPHMVIHVDSYEYQGQLTEVLGDVEDLHAWYQNFLEGLEDDSDDALVSMVDNIVEGKSTELEKVEAIYYWVQQNVKYIAIEDGLGGFRPRGANLVFNRRYGDCKDMSNLLHKMLHIADIPSNLAWIGTTSIPYSHNEVPTPMADNHMICTYQGGDQYYFLDATDQHNTLGMPTTHIQGREALVHKGTSNFELVDVPVVPSERNHIQDSVLFNINNNQLEGNGKVVYSGYNRIPISNNLENLKEHEKRKFLQAILKKGNNTFSLQSAKTNKLDQKNEDLEIEYKFLVNDYVVNVADEIFLNPHLSKELENGLIDLSITRQNIHHPFKSVTSKTFVFQIPSDYKVSYLPKDCSFDQDQFSFNLSYEIIDENVFVNQTININTIQLKTDQFESWNEMVKGLFAAYKESIVLQKM